LPPLQRSVKKGVNPLHEKKPNRLRPLIFLLVAFLAGCVFAGFLLYRYGFADIGKLDSRYDSQHARAAETVRRLEGELDRERELNRQLRDNNTRARELTEGLAASSERNVRNLQDAIGLIGEIREKLKVLEDFYAHSDPNDSADLRRPRMGGSAVVRIHPCACVGSPAVKTPQESACEP
jgi:hypothetical protein